MNALKGAICVLFSAVLLTGVYVGGMVLGWVMAILTIAATVVCVIGGIVVFLSYAVWELWQEFKERRQRS